MTAAALDYTLVHGATEGSLGTLLAAWRMDEVNILLPSMAAFATSPSLGNKIRGALGTTLLKSASAAVRRRLPCDWNHTCSAEIFFGTRPTILLGRHSSEISKPFVISAWGTNDGSLAVRLRIFGLACERSQVIAEATVHVLREGVRWADMSKDGPRFIPRNIKPSNFDVAPAPIPAATATQEAAEMVFISSIDAERGDGGAQPQLLIQRLVRRIALVAPWQGVSLRETFPALVDAAKHVVVEASEETSVQAPSQGGHKFANRLTAPMYLRLSGCLAPLWPALLIGQYTHVGRGASLGLGAYRLIPQADQARVPASKWRA